MARRMISSEIIDNYDFLQMSHSAQLLYISLVIHADENGFVDPRNIIHSLRCSALDLKNLCEKHLVIPSPSEKEVMVITDSCILFENRQNPKINGPLKHLRGDS